MSEMPYLSLCIPTNGIIEWVVPALESIYSQNCNTDDYEVVVTDNGNNEEFNKKMVEFAKCHKNFVYQKTDAVMFLNQIEAFKQAKGMLIKFINHSMTLKKDAVAYLIDFAKKYNGEHPTTYFSNGVLRLNPTIKKCSSFDEFVCTLSYWSSWSAGTAIWKEDFGKIDLTTEFNGLFPHTDILFSNKRDNYYIIDDSPLLNVMPPDRTNKKKGNYDLFNAFAIEYPSIMESLYKDGYIRKRTLQHVIKENGTFVSGLYLDYIVKKKPCAYNLKDYKKSMGRYYSLSSIKIGALIIEIKNNLHWCIRRVLK